MWFSERGLRVSRSFWLLVLLAAVVSLLSVVLSVLLAAALHECGHLLALRAFHVPVEGLHLSAFGAVIHPFTGVDYVDYYKSIIEGAGAEAEIVFANRVQTVLDYTDTVICCDIHTRARSKRLLKAAGAKTVLGLDDLLTAPVDGSGYNPQYGLLGSNKADDQRIKLFPRDARYFSFSSLGVPIKPAV